MAQWVFSVTVQFFYSFLQKFAPGRFGGIKTASFYQSFPGWLSLKVSNKLWVFQWIDKWRQWLMLCHVLVQRWATFFKSGLPRGPKEKHKGLDCYLPKNINCVLYYTWNMFNDNWKWTKVKWNMYLQVQVQAGLQSLRSCTWPLGYILHPCQFRANVKFIAVFIWLKRRRLTMLHSHVSWLDLFPHKRFLFRQNIFSTKINS